MATATISNPRQVPQGGELRISLPPEALEELKELSGRSGRSLDYIVRTALGLVKLAMDEERNDHILLVAKEDGTPLKRVVLK
ncbi:MAG TPA: hypothetical protein VF212_03630 [Longimicrobiales bacterium]